MDFKQSVDPDLLELVWNNSNDALFTVDYDGKVLMANPAFAKILGCAVEDWQVPNHLLVFQEHDQEEFQQLLNTLKSGKNVPYYMTKRKRKDGKVLDILASYGAVNEGNVLAVGTYKDFTEQMEIRRKLESNQESYRNLLEFFPYAVFMIKDDTVIYINQTGMDLIGARSKKDVLGMSVWQLIHTEQQFSIRKLLIEGIQTTVLEKMKRVDGEVLWAEITMMRVFFEGQYVNQLVVRDVTEKKHYEEQLKYFAYHDPLTGLTNRRYFTKEMKKVVEEARRNNGMFGVMFIDMDDFKKVNDTLGHEVGDQLLIKFADRLKKNVREGDVLCRIGGDEFLFLIKNIRGKQTLVEIATRLQKTFQVPYQIEDQSIVVTSSIGIAIFPQDGIDVKTLISNSDQALYEAKKYRKGFVFYKE